MNRIPPEDILEVVGCEIDQRPDAPGIEALRPHIRRVARERGALTVSFAAERAETVEAFAAAERVCCTGIIWDVLHGPETTLKIFTEESGLDALEQVFNPIHIDRVR